ncbi:hypothetical protein IHV10_17000 [Fictibacillus sp. 5RED26]|uniref:hypothetical protein n=1 Tax=Fictibacillus sp. 5RED26 TaxID=2745876 RepID=UPI0018CDF87E|nr:hypothetical protein [Fictibacillus sp. 5RED26]MBH0158082.1 hypothetical protein [Fictibacillus sp. 5RED26]
MPSSESGAILGGYTRHDGAHSTFSGGNSILSDGNSLFTGERVKKIKARTVKRAHMPQLNPQIPQK